MNNFLDKISTKTLFVLVIGLLYFYMGLVAGRLLFTIINLIISFFN